MKKLMMLTMALLFVSANVLQSMQKEVWYCTKTGNWAGNVSPARPTIPGASNVSKTIKSGANTYTCQKINIGAPGMTVDSGNQIRGITTWTIGPARSPHGVIPAGSISLDIKNRMSGIGTLADTAGTHRFPNIGTDQFLYVGDFSKGNTIVPDNIVPFTKVTSSERDTNEGFLGDIGYFQANIQ